MASTINASTSPAAIVQTADGTGILALQTGNTTAVTIDASQNVGIGTTSPSQRLDVQATNGANSFWLTSTTGTNPVYSRYSNTGGYLYMGRDGSAGTDFGAGAYASALWSTGAYPMVFGTNSTIRMTIGSTGRVYIPNAYTETTGNSSNLFVDTDGRLIRATSSFKYKTDVKDATHGLKEVMQLRSVTYKGKEDGEKVFGGLIAEEVHAVGLTEFVQYALDETPDALAYGNMVSLCVKAIQEQQALITSLTARITALEGA